MITEIVIPEKDGIETMRETLAIEPATAERLLSSYNEQSREV